MLTRSKKFCTLPVELGTEVAREGGQCARCLHKPLLLQLEEWIPVEDSNPDYNVQSVV